MYLIVILFFFINMVCFDWLKFQRNKDVIYYFEMIILIMIAGLRYKIGGDTFMYMSFWEEYPTLQDFSFDFLGESDFNALWVITTVICKTICNDFVFFQFIHALFVNIVFFSFFKKYTPYIFSAVFCYAVGHFLYFNTEVLRESLSVCIFMLATPSLLKKQYWKYYFLCLIAYGFHSSAIIMVIAPFLLSLKKMNLKTTIIVSIVVLFLSSVIYFAASSIIEYLNNEIFSYKFSHYTNSEYSITGILYQLFLCLPVGVLIYLNQKNTTQTPDFNNFLCFLFWLYILSFTFNTIAMRFSNYMIPFYIILGLNVFMKPFQSPEQASSNNKQFLFIKTVIIGAFICIFFNFSYFYFNKLEVKYSMHSYTRYYPYTSVFSDDNSHVIRERDRFVRALRNHKKIIEEEE